MYYSDNLKIRIVEIMIANGNKMGRVCHPISIIRLWSEIRNLVNNGLSLGLRMIVK